MLFPSFLHLHCFLLCTIGHYYYFAVVYFGLTQRLPFSLLAVPSRSSDRLYRGRTASPRRVGLLVNSLSFVCLEVFI